MLAKLQTPKQNPDGKFRVVFNCHCHRTAFRNRPLQCRSEQFGDTPRKAFRSFCSNSIGGSHPRCLPKWIRILQKHCEPRETPLGRILRLTSCCHNGMEYLHGLRTTSDEASVPVPTGSTIYLIPTVIGITDCVPLQALDLQPLSQRLLNL